MGYLLAFIGFIIYYTRPNWLFLYWMLAWPILSPILCLVGDLNDPDSANHFLYTQSQFFAYTYLWIIISNHKKLKHVIDSIKPILTLIFVLIFYFLFHSIVTNFSAQQIYLNIKEVIYILLPLLVLIIDKRTIPNAKPMFILVSIIMVIEVIFVYLNYLGINAYIAWYTSVLEFPEFANLATGTFYGSARFPDYCATIFTFLTVDFFSRRKIPFYQYLILSIFCFICLFTAGSRMPLALSIIILFTTVFIYGKEYKISMLCLLVIGYFGLLFLSSYKDGEISENDGVNRIVAGLTEFTQSKKNKDEDHSTIRLSSKLLDQYYWNSPIIGNGRSSLGENAYPIADHISDISNLRADALLAFMLVEYGTLGVLLYFIYFNSIFKYFARFDGNRKKITIFLMFFTILSLTEGGLWDKNLFPYVYLYYMSINKYQLIRNRGKIKGFL